MAIPYIDKGRTIDMSGNDIICRNILTAAPTGAAGFKWLGCNGATPSSVTTTTSTYTVANMLAGVIVNANAGAVTATLDTAANIVAGVNGSSAGANIGDLITFELINGGSASGAITVNTGTGGTFATNVPAANQVVAINLAKTVFVRLTNVTLGSEAYQVYM